MDWREYQEQLNKEKFTWKDWMYFGFLISSIPIFWITILVLLSLGGNS